MSKNNRILLDFGLPIVIWTAIFGIGIYVSDVIDIEYIPKTAVTITALSSIITGFSLVERKTQRFAYVFAIFWFLSLVIFCAYANLDANAFTVISSKRIGMAMLLAFSYLSLSGICYAFGRINKKLMK